MKKGKYEARKEKDTSCLRSYFMSLLSLVLCCAMFMSTTFAWFSVDVVSTGNQIQVGTLQVSLLHHEGANQTPVTAAHQIFDKNVKWQPNHVEVEVLTVKNQGDMAADYKLQFAADAANSVFTDGKTMADVAKWFAVYCYTGSADAATDDLTDPKWSKVGTLEQVINRKLVITQGTLENTGDAHSFAIALQLMAEASVEVMGQKPSIQVKLTANQQGYVETIQAANAQQLSAGLAEGGYVKLTADISTAAAAAAPYGNYYGFALNGGTLDGNGKTLSVTGSGDTYAIMTTGGTVKNLTIDCGFRGIVLMYPEQDLILENVIVSGSGVGYPINTAEAGQSVKLLAKNSTFNGWSSFSNIQDATFIQCSFGQGSYWGNDNDRVVKPYVNTTFTDCSFVKGLYIDLSSLADGCKITLDGCTVDGTVLTAENWQPLLDAIELPAGKTLEDCVIFQ